MGFMIWIYIISGVEGRVCYQGERWCLFSSDFLMFNKIKLYYRFTENGWLKVGYICFRIRILCSISKVDETI